MKVMNIQNEFISCLMATPHKVLAILYGGGKTAEEEPRLLGTVENKLGIQNGLNLKAMSSLVSDMS
jgi:hypothetical protein